MINEDHKTEEEAKKGTLRAGSCGAVINGIAVGECPRKALLRMLGINTDNSYSTLSMFAAGRASEDIVVAELQKSWSGSIQREDEAGIKWTTSQGIAVTGRPDIVLVDTVGTRVEGVELKNVSCIWTAIDVGIERNPKSGHIIQAAHYMWKLGIPYSLLYTSRMNWALTGMAWKIPKDISRDFLMLRGATPLKLLPFDSEFKLDMDGDNVVYYHVDEPNTVVKTFLTMAAIERFYELVAECSIKKEIPPKVAARKVTGEKLSYDPCGYCDFATVCKQYGESSFQCWIDYATAEANKS